MYVVHRHQTSASETAGIAFLEELRFEEACAFLPPVDGFGKGRGQFLELNVVVHDPYVEQLFADASRITGME